jgi:hypothetical protein
MTRAISRKEIGMNLRIIFLLSVGIMFHTVAFVKFLLQIRPLPQKIITDTAKKRFPLRVFHKQ